jgi:outer membrane protein TolC
VVEAERAGAEALRDLAFWSRWSPRLSDTTHFGVVPGARGTIEDSPDSPRDLNDLGPFYRTRLDAVMPLYTFGRLRYAQRAAAAFVESKLARAEAKRATGRELAARAYFGYLLAEQSLDLIADVRRHLDQLLERLQKPPAGEEETDPLDLYKARGYGFELDRLEAKAERGLSVAAAGIEELAAAPARARVRPAAPRLEPLAGEGSPELAPSLERGLEEARAASPELRELDLAARARDYFAESNRREGWPTLAAEGRFEYGRAPGRTRQDNPFVYDPFNVRTLTAAFALRWELNFKQTGAKARKEEAEAAELRAKREALAARTRIEVVEAHSRLVEARKVHEASRRALSTTANWFRVAEENHGLGTASVKDVVEAYAAFVQTRSAQLEAVHDLNLALIAWRLALGREPLAPGEAP